MLTPRVSFPVMVTHRLAEQKRFYEQILGFESVFFEQDFYLHLVHPHANIQLGMLIPNHPSQPEFLHPEMRTGGFINSFEVDDVVSAFEMANKQQLDIALTLKTEPWGQQHFILRDPAGFYVDVIQLQSS